MQESHTTSVKTMYGLCSDGTLVYVELSEYEMAPEPERDNPNYWLEQLVDNPAVWTE